METRRFGDVDVPVIGEGTWKMESGDRSEAIRAIRRAIDLGASHIDNAEMYGRGEVERIVGEALRDGYRDRAFLVSKVLPQNASYEGTRRACEASLKRLGVERLDTYLLHWPGQHPIAETVRAFEELVRDGKIAAWGVSNFDVSDLDEALAVAGPGKIACNQVLYHLEERGIEHRVIPWCERNGVAVVAYSPLGAGSFVAPASTGGRLLAEIARAHDATPEQVALAFLVRRTSVLAIPKAGTVRHVEANAAAASLRLTEDEVTAIDAAFPRGRARGLATL